MAERRMIAKTIIDSDAFLEMPSSTQLLYFHLCLRADDEGFINKPKSIMRLIGCKEDDLKVLFSKKFVIPFDSGVVVIKHWKIHNYIRGDRLHETKYIDEKSQLTLDENQSYTLCQSSVSQLSDTCHTEVRLGKDRIGKVRLGEDKTLGAKTAPHFEDESLNQAFADFVDMRKKIKKPLTDRAIEMQKKKLKELSCLPFSDTMDNELAIKILNQSTMNCWQGLFAIKENQQKGNSRQAIDWDNV